MRSHLGEFLRVVLDQAMLKQHFWVELLGQLSSVTEAFALSLLLVQAMMSPPSLLPKWLQLTAESRGSAQILQHNRCPEQTIRKETCYVEQIDGISVLRCEELIERFRLGAEGYVCCQQTQCISPSSAALIGLPSLQASGYGRIDYQDACATI